MTRKTFERGEREALRRLFGIAIPCLCGHDRMDHDWWGSGQCGSCKCEGFVDPPQSMKP